MISIIIVGYNSKQYLKECLDSVFASSYRSFQVFFIDNNSSDDSAEYVINNFPKCHVLEAEENLGFAAGNNLGIQEALKTTTDYVFLLNPDTIIDRECLSELVKNANLETILQPLILLHNGTEKTELVNSSGNVLNFLGFSYCGDYKRNASQISDGREIVIGSGSGLFFPSEILRKIGLFDEKLFMYHEDVDLSWRARMMGVNIRLIKTARLWHKYTFSKNKNKFFYVERNRLLFIRKNYETRTILLIMPLLIVNEVAILFLALFGGWFSQKIRSYFSFFKLAGSEDRDSIQKKRSKTDRELALLFQPHLDFAEVKIPLLGLYNILIAGYWRLIRPLI